MSTTGRIEELESFKRRIDLPYFTESRGYYKDLRRSSQRYHVMRHANGDKLNISRDPSGLWRYINAYDSRDAGTVIDFVQYRDKISLGEVRKLLRPWLGQGGERLQSTDISERLSLSASCVAKARAAWAQATPVVDRQRYLERCRGISSRLLADPILADRIRTGYRGNALMAHFNQDGLCGFEEKNDGFTRFSPGGTKGLLCTRPRASDTQIVVCETGVDLLSYAELFGTDQKRFFSTAGQFSSAQRLLLQSAAKRIRGCSIVLAVDNDAGGESLAREITAAMEEIGLGGKSLRVHTPAAEGDDWNDVLRKSKKLRAAFPVVSAPSR